MPTSNFYSKLQNLVSYWQKKAPENISNYIEKFFFHDNKDYFIKKANIILNAVIPKKTFTLSVTDNKCELKCSHCNAYYLKFMYPLSKLNINNISYIINTNNYNSILISGGCNKNGEVPILDYKHKVIELLKNFKSNLHVGLIQNINSFYDNFYAFRNNITISLDLLGDDKVVKEVYNLDVKSSQWLEIYKSLYKDFYVVPHITLGLDNGQIQNQINLIDFLSNHKPKSLTFLVFKPTIDTPFYKLQPPSAIDIANAIFYAHTKLNISISIGCMRPSNNNWRFWADRLAWLAGAETIVMPNNSFIEELEDAGISVSYFYECCSFLTNNHKSNNL